MSAAVAPSELERFRVLVAERLGLSFDDSKLAFLVGVLARRVEATRATTASYLQRLGGAGDPEELRALALELTVTETYFFRNQDQFRAFAEVALPERLVARAAARTLRLLSAGCASGEEPYSLAILIRERLANPMWDVSIVAVDVNAVMLEKAARARYSAWALRETPPELQRRWFKGEGRELTLDDEIRKAVAFHEHNLVEDDPRLWAPESYDVVFCRNVIMYFTPEIAQRLIARITRALCPGGYLFLGHAETLRGLSNDYHLRHTHGTFYYQRKDVPSHAALTPPPTASTAPSQDLAWATTWVETVQRASERIHALTKRPARTSESREGASNAGHSATDLNVALELLKRERYSDALALLGRLPAASARDPDILLLRAILLTHGGQLAAAEKVCADLLRLDELNTGAHFVLALCREGAGDRQGAVDHDQVAAYLDPGFAMPRLHLGLLARRLGDREAARRELGQALLLLRREDASRLLLFGGGFGREALVALCRTELVAAGGRP